MQQPLAFAFGVHSRLNEDYGTMKAFYETWSPSGENDGLWEIPTRNCTKADWGINGEPKTNNDFDSPFEEDQPIYRRIMYSMRCFD